MRRWQEIRTDAKQLVLLRTSAHVPVGVDRANTGDDRQSHG